MVLLLLQFHILDRCLYWKTIIFEIKTKKKYIKSLLDYVPGPQGCEIFLMKGTFSTHVEQFLSELKCSHY